MKTAAYIGGLLCSLPLIAFALGILALGHVIETRNVFTILYHAAIAFAWGLPLAALGLVVLVVCGFLPLPRLVASGLLVALNVAAVVVVLRGVGLPDDLLDGIYLGPTLVAFWLHGVLIRDRDGVLPKQRPAPDPNGAS